MVTFPPAGGSSAQLGAISSAEAALNRAVERLSSGLRINSAGDEAAGLALSESIKTKVRSRAQAIRNIQDGISALQIADGGLNEISNMLIRLRELAVQAANGSLSNEQRALIQREVRSLIVGIDEITIQNTYDGRYLLRGPLVDVAFFIDTSGSMGGEIAQVRASVEDFRRSFADAGISVMFGLVDSGHDGGDLTDTLSDIGDGTFSARLAAMLPTSGGQDPYSVLYNATGINDIPGALEPDALHFRPSSSRRIIYITDTDREAAVPGIDPSEANLGDALAAEGFTVDFICSPPRSAPFDGIAARTGGSLYSLGDAAGSNIPDALDAIAAEVREELGGTVGPIEIQAGPTAEERIRLRLPMDMTPPTLGIEELDVSTLDGARRALGQIDAAMGQVAEGRGYVGADAHALESALDAQWIHREGDVTAKSRITDADMAREVSELTRAQILARGGYALRAQMSRIRSDTALFLVNSGQVPIEE